MTCDRCGIVRANLSLIRKYKPEPPFNFDELRERDRQDTIKLAKEKIAKGESVRFWTAVLERRTQNER